MATTLLFVHGTGVREDAYAASLARITKGARQGLVFATVRGCYWGTAEGARLRAGGTSIPTYDDTGGEQPDEAEEMLALWSILYTDPWYELRLLRHMRVEQEVALGQDLPADLLRTALDEFNASGALLGALADADLSEDFDEALVAIRGSSELDEAIATAPADSLEHRGAIARAILAYALVHHDERGIPPLDGPTRDALVERLTDELDGYGLGVGEFLLGPVKGLAKRWATSKLTRDHGAISDAAAPGAGDILRFLAHGEGARGFIASAVADAEPGPVYLLAHSLGGIMCVDLLIREHIPKVAGLITVGSQAPFLYEIGALPALMHPHPLPSHFPAWTNIYDRRDILSYLGAAVFGELVADVEVDNGQPFPQSHSAYWSNRDVWKAIAAAVA